MPASPRLSAEVGSLSFGFQGLKAELLCGTALRRALVALGKSDQAQFALATKLSPGISERVSAYRPVLLAEMLQSPCLHFESVRGLRVDDST